jgi:hypothetical protein
MIILQSPIYLSAVLVKAGLFSNKNNAFNYIYEVGVWINDEKRCFPGPLNPGNYSIRVACQEIKVCIK